MDIEDKLNLIQQIHREQEEYERYANRNYNYMDFSRRSYDNSSFERTQGMEGNVQNSRLASFRLRLLLAVLLFICFFIMEKKEIEVWGIDDTEIVECIGENMSLNKTISAEYFLDDIP